MWTKVVSINKNKFDHVTHVVQGLKKKFDL